MRKTKSTLGIYINNAIAFTIFSLLKHTIFKSGNDGFKKSLLLINTGQIGDLVISSLILEYDVILEEYDNIHFLMKKEYTSLFADYSGKVKIVGYDYKKYKYSISYKIKFLKSLHNKKFEKCINLTAARGILNDEMALLSGSSEVYCLNSNWRYLKKLFGKKIDSFYSGVIGGDHFNEYTKHEDVLKFLSGNNELNIRIFNKNVFKRTIVKDNSAEKIFNAKEFIAIAPYTSIEIKNWDFTNLIRKLSKDYFIILLGSNEQQAAMNKLVVNDNVVSIAGKLDLNEIAPIISNSKLFIGLDSGVTHIAAKMNLPTVAIIGGGTYGRFFPYSRLNQVKYLFHKLDCFGSEWRCKYEEPYCISNVQDGEVIDAVNSFLRQ